MSTVFNRVKKVLMQQYNVKESEIYPEAYFIEDLGADSLDIAEMILDLEEEFGVEIPNKDAMRMKTVGDVVKYFEKLFNDE